MHDWFIALIVLIGVCALGVYYVNGFHGLVPEGFFDLSGVLGVYYLTGANQSVPEGFYSAPSDADADVDADADADAIADAIADADANADANKKEPAHEVKDVLVTSRYISRLEALKPYKYDP